MFSEHIPCASVRVRDFEGILALLPTGASRGNDATPLSSAGTDPVAERSGIRSHEDVMPLKFRRSPPWSDRELLLRVRPFLGILQRFGAFDSLTII